MKKDVLIFAVCLTTVSAIFFLIPQLTLFDGEMVFEMHGTTFTSPAKLSLAYFLGIGIGEGDLEFVKGFHLLPMGYVLAGLMLFGLPLLVTYRLRLKRENKQDNA